MRNRLGLADANLLHPEIVAGEHFDANTIPIDRLARLRDPSEPLGDQPAHGSRLEILFGAERAQKIVDSPEVEVSRHDVAAVPVFDDVAIRLVFIADLADDYFEEIFH